jgi:hypothetical protein
MVWADLNDADHGEVSFTVYLNQIGENAKFELAGDRLGAILGVGVRDDVAKLAAGSIYSARKWWPVNRARRAAGNDEGLTAVRTLIQGRWARGEGLRLAGVASSSPAARILLPRDVIHLPRAQILTPTTRIAAEEWSSVVKCSEPEQATVPWANSFSQPDSHSLGSIFSQTYMVTYSMLCSKIVEL